MTKKDTGNNCPLCGSRAASVLTRSIRGNVSRPVYRCTKCDLGILENGTQTEAEKFYKKAYREQHSHKVNAGAAAKELFDAYVPFQSDRLKLLRPYFGKKKTLVEVGCSSGMFLYHARKEVGKVIGVDYDAPAAAYAAKVCGCKTYGTDISKTPIPKASADIVCAFQTLEHVNDPIGFLKTLGEYTKPGGIVAIEVPNLYDALRSLYDLPNYHTFYFHDAHPWYFSGKSLTKAMKKAGFEGTLHYLQDYNVLNHLHWADVDAPKQGGIAQLAPPELPLRKSAAKAARAGVNDLLQKFDADYKRLLAKHRLTSNLFFIGKKIR
ncbi:hypothetical protein A2766_02600 [Candidatus Kaiserbacteria bacterium RIFCSPHIGHO2_01_FULL_58_22]|nr:MAG: hypothetical protein A2766_02600 [Candidatus Kaiserbacteria bacterium RIFCSPHIGHO2_01_FULL_58_22]